MTSTFSTNLSLEEPANGDYVNTWSTPVNANWNVLDAAFGNVTSINVTSVSGTVTLSTAQYRPRIVKFTGTLTANVTYRLPSGIGGVWFISNNTTGAFTITFASAGGGTTVTLPQGYTTPVVSDGTNIVIGFTQPSSVAAAGSDSWIQYNSGGVLGATGNLNWQNTSNTLLTVNVNATNSVTTSSFIGTLTGSCTGSSGSCTGNAATATYATSAGSASNATTAGSATTATTATTAGNVSGTVAIANGGTGNTTAATALAALGGLGVTASTLGTPGYLRLTNGFTIQWGSYTHTADTYLTVNFPYTFPVECSSVVTSGASEQGNANANANGSAPDTISTTGFSAWNAGSTRTYWYIAIGV